MAEGSISSLEPLCRELGAHTHHSNNDERGFKFGRPHRKTHTGRLVRTH